MRTNILEQLATYRPQDPVEQGYLTDLCKLLSLGDDLPFDRNQFDPGHITASAFVVSPDGSELLMIHHGKLHRWLQPGGHVDPEDSSVEAASIREVEEETGLVLTPTARLFDLDVHTIPARKAEPEHQHYDIRYWFRADTREGILAGDDAEAVRWVKLSRVPELAPTDGILRPLGKLTKRGSNSEAVG